MDLPDACSFQPHVSWSPYRKGGSERKCRFSAGEKRVLVWLSLEQSEDVATRCKFHDRIKRMNILEHPSAAQAFTPRFSLQRSDENSGWILGSSLLAEILRVSVPSSDERMVQLLHDLLFDLSSTFALRRCALHQINFLL